MELVVSPESSMSFTGIIQFFDNKGQVYKLPIICTADASITSNFPWLSLHSGYYTIEVQAGKPHMLNIVSQLMDTDLDEMGNICYKTPGSPVQGSPGRSKPALIPNAAFLCACKEITDQKSLDFLLEYCNMAVFKQAINKFPADIHGVRGKMIIDIIQESTGKAVPGRIKKDRCKPQRGGSTDTEFVQGNVQLFENLWGIYRFGAPRVSTPLSAF